MNVQRRRRFLIAAALAVLVVAAGVAAMTVIRNETDGGADPDRQSSVSSALVTQRDLTEYLEVSGTLDYEGTVTLAAHNSGVLMHLADEGTVVRQGEQLYLVLHEPTDAETARILADVASARDALAVAADNLNDAISGPSDADVASARAAVAEAIEARDRLIEPPSTAEISSAQAALAVASDALAALDNPTAGDLAAARADIATAEAALAELKAGATKAEIESAEAAVQTANQALTELKAGATEAEIESAEAAVQTANQALTELKAGATEAETKTAEAARRAAWERLRDELQISDNEVEIDLARAELLTAEEHLADLRAGPTQAEIDDAESQTLTAHEHLADLLAGATQPEIDDAEAKVLTAQEALVDLLADPTEAEVDEAEAQVLAASERLDLLENPTDTQYSQARADVNTAAEALADLRAGHTQAEADAANAAVLAAEQALADLLAEPSTEELAALEAALASAQAALVSAQADSAAHDEVYRPLYAMYGDVPAYRNMTVGLDGDDIRQLEENLAALGVGDTKGFEVDGVFDEHTAEAVRRWQHETGQHIDGMVSTADVLFIAGPSQIGPWEQGVEIGQELEVGRSLASLTVVETPVNGELSTTQRVSADLPLGDRDLISVGIAVIVELPDDTDVAGTVTAINPSPVLDEATGENVVEVTILLSEPASPTWIGATVTVEITETLISDALVVPATALLALAEGGSAVEVLDDDGSTRLVGVETGLFVDGDVEVISAQLAAGMRVVVPR